MRAKTRERLNSKPRKPRETPRKIWITAEGWLVPAADPELQAKIAGYLKGAS